MIQITRFEFYRSQVSHVDFAPLDDVEVIEFVSEISDEFLHAQVDYFTVDSTNDFINISNYIVQQRFVVSAS